MWGHRATLSDRPYDLGCSPLPRLPHYEVVLPRLMVDFSDTKHCGINDLGPPSTW